jgi:hypothetical protein
VFVASGFSATPCKPEGMFLTTNPSSDPEGADPVTTALESLSTIFTDKDD